MSLKTIPITNIKDPNYKPVKDLESFHIGYSLGAYNTNYLIRRMIALGWSAAELDEYLRLDYDPEPAEATCL